MMMYYSTMNGGATTASLSEQLQSQLQYTALANRVRDDLGTSTSYLTNGNSLSNVTGLSSIPSTASAHSTHHSDANSHSHKTQPQQQAFPSYKRMAQRRKVPEGELCAVCSDLATGYHYGVASCNGW
ncbi:hypothetical protein WR25_06292 [Diploscapter pachys]|uniref:Nuclear receptor domain-containing protein n=1 Tax=Diploscapter pachys TaxID=2018661 RepID=A0A2A2JZ10_9BILA|nr:hypothetical protein WR25_06292 [Diploscapter pachys]